MLRLVSRFRLIRWLLYRRLFRLVRMLRRVSRFRLIRWLLYRGLLRLIRMLRLVSRFRLICWLLYRGLFRLVRMLRLVSRFRLICWLLYRGLFRLVRMLRLVSRFRLICWLLYRGLFRLVSMLRLVSRFRLIRWLLYRGLFRMIDRLSLIPWQRFRPCLRRSGILRGQSHRIGNAMTVQQRIVGVKIAGTCRTDAGEQNIISICRTRCAGARKKDIVSGNRRTAGAVLNLVFGVIHPFTREQRRIGLTPHRIRELLSQTLAAS